MRALTLALVLVVAAASIAAADGKKAFLDNSCDRCHSVEAHDIEATVKSERMRGPDLSETGKTRDADWFAGYLAKDLDLEGKPHRAMYRGSDEDLRTISDWLASLDGSE